MVTGGAGFVGPHLIRRLLDEGFAVAVVDNFSAGAPAHIAPFESHSNFRLMEGDITDAAFVREAVASFHPGIVYHLAAIHFIPYCAAHPRETLQVNVVGTQNLLDALEGSAVSRFILASTGDVYAPSDSPHAESDPLGSSNIYGMSKMFCERLLSLAERRYPETLFSACRFFNIYGPGETNPHVLPDILAGLRKGNILRMGNMDTKRDYIHVSDVAAALVRLASYTGPRRVFNIGTGIGSSVQDLIQGLEKALGSAVQIEIDPSKVRRVERQNLVADISLARKELSWSPQISLEKGLKNLLKAEFSEMAST